MTAIPPIFRRWVLIVLVIVAVFSVLSYFTDYSEWRDAIGDEAMEFQDRHRAGKAPSRDAFRKWRVVKTHFPLRQMYIIPSVSGTQIPRIQADFSKRYEAPAKTAEREKRLAQIKEAFEHTWSGYKKYAWMHDEVGPISGQPNNRYGGWGATLVDSLDTLWIMGMEKEFKTALGALRQIDFTTCAIDELNVFETTIRHLGGLLGAYDLTGGHYGVLLEKAIELGEMLYHAFDTENRLPITRWKWKQAESGDTPQSSPDSALLAEMGSLTLEFTRLTQLTQDPKYFDAVHRISELLAKEQDKTAIPGLWGVSVNPHKADFHSDNVFTLGGMADSVFEYLPKEWLLLKGRIVTYQQMYEKALESIKDYLVFQPLVPPPSFYNVTESTEAPYEVSIKNTQEPLLLGTAVKDKGPATLKPEGQHLTCFAGGMVALGARAMAWSEQQAKTEADMELAARLVEGCVWSYRATATGIGPEIYMTHPCRQGRDALTNGASADVNGNIGDCTWNRTAWLEALRIEQEDMDWEKKLTSNDPAKLEEYLLQRHLREGFTKVVESKYMLRPEAIESIFIMWRTTGHPKYQEMAWEMWTKINKLTRTRIAYAQLEDVTVDPPLDKNGNPQPTLINGMESFWTAETLKYFYLIFSDPDVMSLDEFVYNTEAHPLRWRKASEIPNT